MYPKTKPRNLTQTQEPHLPGLVPPALTQGLLHLGQRDCPQLPTRGLLGCLPGCPASSILGGALTAPRLGCLLIHRSWQRGPGLPKLVVAPVGHAGGGDRCWGWGAPASGGLASTPAAAVALGRALALALALALPRVLWGQGFCQQPVRPWGPGSDGGWLGRGCAGASVWGEGVYWHVLERGDPFMRVAGSRGTQGELEAPQTLPQFPIVFLLREAVHRQQVETSTSVWGRGPRSGCPSSPAGTTLPGPSPRLRRCRAHETQAWVCSGPLVAVRAVRDSAWVPG